MFQKFCWSTSLLPNYHLDLKEFLAWLLSLRTNICMFEEKAKIPNSQLSSSTTLIFCGLAIAILSISPKAMSEEVNVSNLEKKPNLESESPQESRYQIPPHILDKKNVHPFTTSLNLSGIPINHLTKFKILSGYNYNFKEGITRNIDFNTLMTLDSQVKESLTVDNIITIEQTGTYIQLGTLKNRYQIIENIVEPETLLGFELQLSLLGSCQPLGVDSDHQCVYTPGLQIDRNSIDPDSLAPTRVIQGSKFGDVVTPESLDLITTPGFQSGANGQIIGLDLFFPNSGGTFGNSQSNETTISRKEESSNTSTVVFSRVRQTVRANHEKAVIGRSIRGLGVIVDNDNLLLTAILQLGTELLPNSNPTLTGSTQPVNPNINKNLFFAANNNRVPPGSFTSYQIGLGSAITPKSNQPTKIPASMFNSVWVGMSPVTKRTYTSKKRYETIGPLKTIAAAGGEGGGKGGATFPDSVISIINGESFPINNTQQDFQENAQQNFHNQIYLAFFNQEAFAFNSTILNEEINYYPHFSFTGNITKSNRVLRYYTGIITADKLNRYKGYIGADWTEFFGKKNRWTSELGAIAYFNPDRDYYSQLWGAGSRRFLFSQKANLTLGMNFNWTWDRESKIGEVLLNSPSNFLRVSGNLGIKQFSLGINYVVGDVLPGSTDSDIVINWGVNLRKNLKLSTYYNVINNNSRSSPYGATLQIGLGKNSNYKTLSLIWNHNKYDYGQNAAEQELVIRENNVRLTFSTVF